MTIESPAAEGRLPIERRIGDRFFSGSAIRDLQSEMAGRP
jgi:hypothetical protein